MSEKLDEVILDGKAIPANTLNEKQQEAKSKDKLIKEITPGTFKTLTHLRD